jgi:hypothetical protein
MYMNHPEYHLLCVNIRVVDILRSMLPVVMDSRVSDIDDSLGAPVKAGYMC